MTTEQDFTNQVVTLARYYGWLVYHPLPGQGRGGRWTTPTQGDTGWPDLALAKQGPGGGFIAAELKTDKGRLSENQTRWLDMLRGVGVEAHVWRPSQLDEITDRLARRHDPEATDATVYRIGQASAVMDLARDEIERLRAEIADKDGRIAEYRDRVHYLNEDLLEMRAALAQANRDIAYLDGLHLPTRE